MKHWNTCNVSKDSDILKGLFVPILKNYETPNESTKVRFVAQGLGDSDKPFMVHDTSTLWSTLIRMILSTASIRFPQIFFYDVTQAYLQSKHKINCKIYIRIRKQDVWTFGLGVDDLPELNEPLYGLCDAGDY